MIYSNVFPLAMPHKDPVIIGAPKLVKPGEQMLLNCTSDYSLPPSEINWYIDNELQKVRAIREPRQFMVIATFKVNTYYLPLDVVGTCLCLCVHLLLVLSGTYFEIANCICLLDFFPGNFKIPIFYIKILFHK